MLKYVFLVGMNRTVYVCLGDRGKEAKGFNLSRYCFSAQRRRAISSPPARPFHSPALSELLGGGLWKSHLRSAAHGQVDAHTPLALPHISAITKAQQVQSSKPAISIRELPPAWLPSPGRAGPSAVSSRL